MRIKSRMLCAFAMFFGVGSSAYSATWLKTGDETSRPAGHMEYCSKHPSDCRKKAEAKALAPAAIGPLQTVNNAVNKTIKPVSDQVQFGVRDKWTVNAKSGDCEDFALAKRAALMRHGYKSSNLLMAMGHAAGQAHAVLVVRTQGGDYVLDNLTDAVLPVNRARVSITKIQSPANASVWLRVTGQTNSAS